MVCGYLPFNEESEEENVRNILKGKYKLPEEEGIKLSDDLVDLISHLLDIDIKTRYNLQQIKEHPWYKNDKKKENQEIQKIQETQFLTGLFLTGLKR